MHIEKANLADDRTYVETLFWEYLTWADERLKDIYEIDVDIRTMHEESIRQIEIFFPPNGCVMLAKPATTSTQPAHPVGIACLKTLAPGIGELKRMYVRPTYQRQGIGKALVQAVFEEAKRQELHTLRLDSTRFMKGAHALYQQMGFQPRDPYPESEIPLEYQPHWLFFEAKLSE
jgi:GNAT superfamily N-acetyltransferase